MFDPPLTQLTSAVGSHPTVAPIGRKDARRARRAELLATTSDPLLNAKEGAAETGRALSTFWRDVKRRVLPAPYYVTPRAPRWRLSELRAAVEAAPRTPSTP
jgi:predicted DNA-binding transcriptional regulator AlpA